IIYSINSSVMDASGVAHLGVLFCTYLAAWRASVETTISFAYGNFEVHKTRAWGQGPVFLQQLALLDDLAMKEVAFLSAEHIHLVVEGAKLAFADREAWYGDDAGVPLAALLSHEYAASRRALISGQASHEFRP